MRLFRRRRIRSRNKFVIVVIVIAIVLVLAALLAYFLLVKKQDIRPVPPAPPPPPPPVQPFPARELEKWNKIEEPPPPEPTKPRRGGGGRSRPESLGDSAINAMMRRLATSFNQCARQYGGVDGSQVRVGFSISPEGSVTGANSFAPHSRTPLGRCIANVIGGARFGRSEFGRNDVRWSITLHP